MNHTTPTPIAPAPPANPGVPASITFATYALGAAEKTMTRLSNSHVEPAPPARDDGPYGSPPEGWDEEVLEDLPAEEQVPVTPT